MRVTGQHKLVIVGPPRSGTTLLAALLASLGVDFGIEQRSWDINSGYYEHPKLLNIYGKLRKHKRLAQISDNLADKAKASAVTSLKLLLSQVCAIKYPPISAELPFLAQEAGYQPFLVITARLFEPYAISRMRMEGLGFTACKQDYLETYKSAILLSSVYDGVVIDYHDLTSVEPKKSAQQLALLTKSDIFSVKKVIADNVGKARSHTSGLTEDPECRAVYDQLISLSQG